ncbi:MAG: transposase [Clostridium sp.]|uniref:transposase n=1 Tax=Clostridia TaxID=186801 RepID=UPI000B06379D|nr:transposase [Clostridium sp. AT4]MBS5088777.1 transposase [Clostridiaceae bacterium]
MSTQKILDIYVERWPVEVFCRQIKDKLAFDRYQICSLEGIRRYWLLMSSAYLLACT